MFDDYCPKQEKINVITHFPGVLLGLIGLIYLLLKPINSTYKYSYLIYGISLICIFLASSIYHKLEPGSAKALFKKIDHAAIYFFMGGCYTPFIIINMHNDYKLIFLFIIWTLVILGVLQKSFSFIKNKFFSVFLYVSFGFLCFAVKGSLLDQIPSISFNLLVLGGVAYVLGVFFYLMDRIPYNHGIWHIFVLIGAGSHYAAVYTTH